MRRNTMKICAISDLHGNLPTIPDDTDLLLIGGDICPNFSGGQSEKQRAWFLREFLGWLEKQPVKDVLGTWGNHDFLPNPGREWSKLEEFRPIIKVDELIEYPHESGMLKIWFSPWSNQFGNWAWMKDPEDLKAVYAAIPEDVDIIVSHQPPRGFCDSSYVTNHEPVGSKELLNTILRVRPEAVICGHIHGGHGWKKLPDRGIVYNVSIVDERYQPVNPPTIIEWS
jgi:Icc-related predicted phosphoesterase